jgi:serine/threonine-protein kinase
VSTAIMNSLSQLPDLRVVPRALVTRYRSDAADLKQVARELDVPVLLTGRIKQDGDSLVVEAELTDTAAQSQLWGQRFSRSAADLVEIQEEITVAVAEHLSGRLTAEDRRKLAKRATSDPEAYKLYLQGHSFWDQWTEASIAASLDYYRQATHKDPTYALAYAGLANSYIALSFLNSPPRVSMPLAKDNVTKALALDDALPEVHYLLGVVNLYFDWDRPAAERQFQRALALNPRYAAAHYAVGNALVVAGRLQDARAEIEQSVQLDPFSNTWNEQLVVFYSGLGELDRAEDQARKSIARDPTSFWLHVDLAMIMVRRGNAADALSEFEQADRISGGNPYAIGYLGFGQARAGRRAAALNTLDRLDGLTATRYVPSFTRALVHAGLGDTERSFAELQKAREERDCWLLWYFILDGAFDGLKGDPRYAKLLEPLRVSTS